MVTLGLVDEKKNLTTRTTTHLEKLSCNTALTTVVKGRIVGNAAVFFFQLLRTSILFNSAAGDGRLGVISSAIPGFTG